MITPTQLKTAFLRQRQSLPLHLLKQMSIRRIVAWREYWLSRDRDVYVSLGGKDSHALLHLVRSVYPDIPAVFVDTGLEYPEVRELNFRTSNVVVIKPKLTFPQVIERYGWPVISKKIAQYLHEIQHPTESNKNVVRLRTTGFRSDGTFSPMSKISSKWLYLRNAPFNISDKCCKVMKVRPLRSFASKNKLVPLIGTTSDESKAREHNFIRHGCNAYETTSPVSTPLIFWTEQHVLQYLRENEIEVPACYGKQIFDGKNWHYTGTKRTGCMFCAFGAHLEPRPNRFEKMSSSHPHIYDYCINKLGLGSVLDYCGIPYQQNQLSLFGGAADAPV